MIRVRTGRVLAVTDDGDDLQTLRVECEGDQCDAINYPLMTGRAQRGDSVSLNTTAVSMKLGTGGVHFVMAIEGKEHNPSGSGHIMKIRYTPSQIKVRAVEEESSPAHAVMQSPCNLAGMPVAVATLHSLLAPFAVAFKQMAPHARLAYIMTDGAALAAPFSRLLRLLRQENWIDCVITCGHAFGGDLEAVTPYSAFQAAQEVAKCHACIVAMGPGVVGTGTPLGTTALEQAPLLDAAGALGARTLAVPRISFADPRLRHQGVSHHTLTALGRLTQRSSTIVLPVLAHEQKTLVLNQLRSADIVPKHRLVWEPVDNVADVLANAKVKVTTMGRTPAQDEAFFAAGAAAGRVAASLYLK